MAEEFIRIRGAREHNLKNIDLDIPREKLVVITGLSGSGKSSLAFDTIFAEGQRRYVESLSAYARQFLGMLEKPDVDHIDGLSPAISIDQKGASRNPRSTVGTVTEVYDYLRLLFARIGVPHCPSCGREISQQTVQQMVDTLLNLPDGTRYMILAPIVQDRKGEYRQVFEDARKAGYVRVRVDGTVYDLEETPTLDRYKQHTIEIVVDRLVNRGTETDKSRVADSLETALRLGSGVVRIVIVDGAGGARAESDVSGLRAGSSRVDLQRSTDGSQEKMDSRFRGNDGEDDGSEMDSHYRGSDGADDGSKMDSSDSGNDGEDDGGKLDSSPVLDTGQAFRGNDGAETEGEIDSRLGRNDGDAAEGEIQSRPAQSIGQALGGSDGEGPERLADDIPNPSDRHCRRIAEIHPIVTPTKDRRNRNTSDRLADGNPNPSNRHSGESRNPVPDRHSRESSPPAGARNPVELLFSEQFACVHCGISLGEVEPRTFSFNSPHGACPECTGIGTTMVFDPGPHRAEQAALAFGGRHSAVVAAHRQGFLPLPGGESGVRALRLLPARAGGGIGGRARRCLALRH